jgi:hypothetical protein
MVSYSWYLTRVIFLVVSYSWYLTRGILFVVSYLWYYTCKSRLYVIVWYIAYTSIDHISDVDPIALLKICILQNTSNAAYNGPGWSYFYGPQLEAQYGKGLHQHNLKMFHKKEMFKCWVTCNDCPNFLIALAMSLIIFWTKGPGPDHWGDKFAACKSTSQSPVDIVTASGEQGAVQSKDITNQFQFSSAYSATPVDMIIQNSGNTGTRCSDSLDWLMSECTFDV